MKRRIKAWFNEEEYAVLRKAVEVYHQAVDTAFDNESVGPVILQHITEIQQTVDSLENKLCKIEVLDDDDNAR